MAILIKKLDSIFLPDKGRRQFNVFTDMYSLRRDESENIKNFVSRFEHKYFKFKLFQILTRHDIARSRHGIHAFILM